MPPALLVTARLVRDLLVGTVWAGALTALALDGVVFGVLLGAAGVLQLVHIRHTPSGSLFGARSTPTPTPAPARSAPTTTDTAGRGLFVDHVPTPRPASVPT